MLNKIRSACSWLVSQVKAGIAWVKNNWPAILNQATEVARSAYAVAINHVRKAVLCFNRGVVTAIETAERRQAMPFQQAFAEARAVVKAMNDEQVSNFVAYWFCQEPAQTIPV